MADEYKDRYITSLEEQINLYKKQQVIHEEEVAKLNKKIQSLEEQLRNRNAQSNWQEPIRRLPSIHDSHPDGRRLSPAMLYHSPTQYPKEETPSSQNSPSNHGLKCRKCGSISTTRWIEDPIFPQSFLCFACHLKQNKQKFDLLAKEAVNQIDEGKDHRSILQFPAIGSRKRTFDESIQIKSNYIDQMRAMDESRASGPACDGCRTRKRKCDRAKPYCAYCVKLHKGNEGNPPCTYPSPFQRK
ncbi:hypothetical protein HK103_006657 [Boothiomyces macroporosus]|uniref:Zn(2)-C6 fungal-type domain-containing protein n=1 Tax=Boothiomyces macroporosus TaxID=261099 RepID=A0AAD5Y4H9_9FUNG|nr:hypothetical protein HK103_006657 [Boothiomyces macroporosus]